jgi:hypothetical protein
LDCIFKTCGLIPRNHSCRSCLPLNALLSSIGYSKKESQAISKRIIRSFQIVKFEDVSRDESKFGFISKTMTFLLSVTLPKQMRRVLKRSNDQIRVLEDSDPSAINYINQISRIGGELFESASMSKSFNDQLKEIGVIITKALVVNDMKKDLRIDKRTENFNAFTKCNQEEVNFLFRCNIAPFNKLIESLSVWSRKEVSSVYDESQYDDCGCPCFCYAFSFFPKIAVVKKNWLRVKF